MSHDTLSQLIPLAALVLLLCGCQPLWPGPLLPSPVSPSIEPENRPAEHATTLADPTGIDADIVRAVEQALTEIAQARPPADPEPPPSRPGTNAAEPATPPKPDHPPGSPLPEVTIWGQPQCLPCETASDALRGAGWSHELRKDIANYPAYVARIIDREQTVPILTWTDPRGRTWYVAGWPGLDNFLRRVRPTLESQ